MCAVRVVPCVLQEVSIFRVSFSYSLSSSVVKPPLYINDESVNRRLVVMGSGTTIRKVAPKRQRTKRRRKKGKEPARFRASVSILRKSKIMTLPNVHMHGPQRCFLLWSTGRLLLTRNPIELIGSMSHPDRLLNGQK
jgi:hypothetical protein